MNETRPSGVGVGTIVVLRAWLVLSRVARGRTSRWLCATLCSRRTVACGVTSACKCPARRGHDSGGVASQLRPLEIIVDVDMELPEIRAWARAELSGYTDGQVDRVICKWNRADSTRRELRWLEHALRWRRSRQVPARADEIGCIPLAGRAL